MAWVPILAFFVLTVSFSLEGWACWIMIMPLFLISASLGGFLGGWIKTKGSSNNLQISFLVLLPFILAPLESMIAKNDATFRADTFIDINAPVPRIWSNVTRVSEIPEQQNTGNLSKFLGLPRPLKAELNYEGVGARREAIFTNGLVFHETVTEYEHERKLVLSVKANPHEIPSTALDEHVMIGGKFFEVQKGTYEIEKLNRGKYRLHLYSHFILKTHFNFYVGWWAKWIMKDIQQNILRAVKARAEGKVNI